MMLLRILKSIYPLLKDILLEGKSIKEVAKNKKSVLLLLVGVLLSLLLNYFLIPRVFSLSARIVLLEKEHKAALESCQSNSDPNTEYNRLDYYRDGLMKK